MVDREITGSILDRPLLERILAEFQVELVFHLAALLSTRSEFTPVIGAPGQRRGHAQPARVRAARSGVARPARSSSCIRRRLPSYGLPDLDDQGARRAGSARTSGRIRRRCTGATSCIASSSDATTRGTTSSWRPNAASGRVDFRSRAVPGTDLGGDGAVRRHVGLRAGDDSRRGEGRAVRVLRPARHAHSVHGDARRRRRAAAAGGGAARSA